MCLYRLNLELKKKKKNPFRWIIHGVSTLCKHFCVKLKRNKNWPGFHIIDILPFMEASDTILYMWRSTHTLAAVVHSNPRLRLQSDGPGSICAVTNIHRRVYSSRFTGGSHGELGGGERGPLKLTRQKKKNHWNWLIKTFTLLSIETLMIKHSSPLIILKARGEWF